MKGVTFNLSESHAERLLNRLYEHRYNDVEETTVAFQVPVHKAIEELEQKFPNHAKDFSDND